jgi:AraC-like DNA-binding protein
MQRIGTMKFIDDDICLYYGKTVKKKFIAAINDFPVMLVMLFHDQPEWQLFNFPANNIQSVEIPARSNCLQINISISLAKNLIPQEHKLWFAFNQHIAAGEFSTLNAHFLPVTPVVKQLVHSMLNKRFTVASLGNLYVRGKVLELFPLLLEQSAFQAEITNDKELMLVNRATDLMDKMLGSRFTISLLVDALKTNETTLKQAFKKIHNMTLYKYFQQVRMAKANQDLKEGKSVTDVAALAGYSSISHFSYAYGKIFGESPTSMHRKP